MRANDRSLCNVKRAFKDHRITVEADDGINRCIMFSNPKSSAYHARLITYAGGLTITGDFGTY